MTTRPSPHQVAQTKIWCYGPETDGANLVVDSTVGVQYLIEIKDPIRKNGKMFFLLAGWLQKLFLFFGWKMMFWIFLVVSNFMFWIYKTLAKPQKVGWGAGKMPLLGAREQCLPVGHEGEEPPVDRDWWKWYTLED